MTPTDNEIRKTVAQLERDTAVLQTEMETVREALNAIRSLPIDVAKLVNTVERCGNDTAYLRKKMDEREHQRKEEHEEAKKEKKADRRWFIATMFTTGGFLVAAASFLIDKF